jgi:hypothetical protein
MQAMLTSLKTPVWANAEHTLIDCVITTSQFGDEKLPFTASSIDVEAHGRALFERIVAGEFGPIGKYVEPIIPTPPAEIPITEA